MLIKSGRREALRYVHAGWIAALALGAVTWVAASYVVTLSGASREVTEGVTALLAAVMLLYVGFWMHGKSQARQWQAYLDRRLAGALARAQLLEAGGNRPDLVGSQWGGARGCGVGQSVALVVKPREFCRDARQLLDPTAPDEEEDEVADGSAQLGKDLFGDGHALLERRRRGRPVPAGTMPPREGCSGCRRCALEPRPAGLPGAQSEKGSQRTRIPRPTSRSNFTISR